MAEGIGRAMGRRFKHPVLTCPWCERPVTPGGPRMRLHQSETVRFSGNTLATFHVECGDDLLDLLEERRLQSPRAEDLYT